jgi:hypothetical protein
VDWRAESNSFMSDVGEEATASGVGVAPVAYHQATEGFDCGTLQRLHNHGAMKPRLRVTLFVSVVFQQTLAAAATIRRRVLRKAREGAGVKRGKDNYGEV